MAVELLEDKKRWDQFVENSPQGLLFHKWDFLKTVERHSRYQFLPYGVYVGEKLRCEFPFFITRDRLGLTHMLSPPPHAQIPYLGFAFDPSVQAGKAHTTQKLVDQVAGELCREIDRIAPNFVNFRTVPNFLDVRSFIWKNFSAHLSFTNAIDLEKSVDEIWASFSQSCRKGIKHVSAQLPEVQQTNDASPLLDIWRERFREHEIPVPLLSDSYLKELLAAFPQDVTVYSASIDGRLAIATACCVLQKKRYGYWIGGVSGRKDLHVQEYLIWEIVRRAKSDGFKKLDLFGAPNKHISDFKSKFSPIIEPFCYVEKTDKLGKIVKFAGSKLGEKQILRRRSGCASNGAR
jgi:hypothetical protein